MVKMAGPGPPESGPRPPSAAFSKSRPQALKEKQSHWWNEGLSCGMFCQCCGSMDQILLHAKKVPCHCHDEEPSSTVAVIQCPWDYQSSVYVVSRESQVTQE